MIRKSEKVIVTFHTTTAAMAMEALCKAHGAPGRIIPVPGAISAGCGLAWCAAPEDEPALLRLMEAHAVRWQDIHRCMI